MQQRVLRLPGVYRPQEDTDLLIRAMQNAAIPDYSRVLDFCCGSGVLGMTAAQLGAESVTAVDVSWLAFATTWINSRLRNSKVTPLHGDLGRAREAGPFDVIVSNPPYVACAPGPRKRPSRRWDAGPEGRDVIDCLCTSCFDLLRPGGVLLLVQSQLTGEDETLDQLRRSGMKASVVSRSWIPFGPVMRSRRTYLQRKGLIGPRTGHEQLVVIRGDKPDVAQ